MLNFVSYLASAPVGPKNDHKREILKLFASGVRSVGDNSLEQVGNDLVPARVAFIQGWIHEHSPNTPHLLLRKKVSVFQQRSNNHTLIVDSNLFNYIDGNKLKTYSRFSFDGVFPPTGNYFWDNPDPLRWQSISKNLGIKLKPWRQNGSHILICTQRNGGWSMKNLDVSAWLSQTINEIRKHSNRPIVVRAHPGDKNSNLYLTNKDKRYRLSANPLILQDFINAHAVVTYNSSPGVAAAIEGIPCFVTDPNPAYSQASEVANTDLSRIENPLLPDRQQWIEKISMCHWNRDEIKDGSCWLHIKKYL